MKITKLEPMQYGGFRLTFDDGSSAKTTSAVVADFGLHSGMELDEERASQLMERIAVARTNQRAANMIGRRPLSKKELVRKLKEKGESPDNAENAADRMEQLGFINDAQYAEYLVRKYSEKGYGRSRIKNELYSRGVPREYWEDALENLEDPSDKIDAFLRTKLAGRNPDQKELKKITDALCRRGFGWEDIRSALRRYEIEVNED